MDAPQETKPEKLKPANLQIGTRKVLMSTLFAGTGAFVTFRPLFLNSVISPPEIGSIMLIGSIITTFTNPVMSAMADQMKAQKALMQLSTIGQAATQMLMLVPGMGYKGQLVLCTLHSMVGAHNFPTFDASTMAVCPSRYGEIRLLGSAAFGLAAFGGGGLISLAGGGKATYMLAFGVASLFQLVSMPLIQRLDFTALQAKPKKVTDPTAPTGVAALVKVFSSAKMFFFIAIVFMSGWQVTF